MGTELMSDHTWQKSGKIPILHRIKKYPFTLDLCNHKGVLNFNSHQPLHIICLNHILTWVLFHHQHHYISSCCLTPYYQALVVVVFIVASLNSVLFSLVCFFVCILYNKESMHASSTNRWHIYSHLMFYLSVSFRGLVALHRCRMSLHPAPGHWWNPHVYRGLPIRERHRRTQTQRLRRHIHRLVR